MYSVEMVPTTNKKGKRRTSQI